MLLRRGCRGGGWDGGMMEGRVGLMRWDGVGGCF
jgi:hypothetical protein